MDPSSYRAALEARLGPVVVAAARRVVDQAPPLKPEQIAHLRVLFAAARRRRTTPAA